MSRERKDELGGSVPWSKDASVLPKIVDAIESANESPLRMARCLARKYWDWPMVHDALTSDTYSDPNVVRRATDAMLGELGFNLSREIIEALCARICRTLACKIQTVGGDSSLKNQAKNLTRMIDGLNDTCKTRSVLERAAKASCYGRGFGAAIAEFDPVSKTIIHKKLDEFGVFFLIEEGDETPTHIYLIRAMPREYLQDTFTKYADRIAGLPVYHPEVITGVDPSSIYIADTVKVYEGWKIRRGEIKGHKATVCADGLVLEDREYPHDCHQVVIVKLFDDRVGPGGWAIGRGISPFHRFQNDLISTIDSSLRGAIPRVVKQAGTTVTSLGTIPYEEFEWDGGPKPQIEVPNPVSPQVFGWFDQLRAGAYSTHGVSQSMSSGQMPAGLQSSPSLRDYAGFADDRQQSPAELWKQAWIDMAKADVALASENFTDAGILVTAPGSDFLQEIKWGDVDMAKNRYRIRFSVASGLVGSGPYRIQQMSDLQSMGQAGPIEMADATADAFPDVAAFVDGIAAPMRLAERMIDDALELKWSSPSALCGQDLLNYLQKLGTQRMCQVELSGEYTRAQKDMLRKLIRAAQRKQAAPLPAANRLQPGPVMAPGMIQGVGSPVEQAIARNRYEAASMGMNQFSLEAAQPVPQVPQG